MHRIMQYIKDTFRQCDKILLTLCVVATAFGCLIIASTTNGSSAGAMRYLSIQFLAAAAGVLCYLIFSSIDANFFAEQRFKMIALNIVLLLMLIPFGTDNGTGNRSWLNFPFLPFDIQPAEICKITFVLILASVMASRQNNISRISSLAHMFLHLALIFCLNMLVSRDMGVSLIFVVIFALMVFAGGISWFWIFLAVGVLIVGIPIVWNYGLDAYQQNRIAVLLNPALDPNGTGARYHTVRALKSLTGGGMMGQGLFNGNRTQRNLLFAQHTDFIFSAIGEELGFVGCGLVLVLLFLIVARCIWVGLRSPDYMRRMICFGASGALICQILVNIGMCLDVMPVIGLTLPFISYGGSSLITLYVLMGLVSGVFARPRAPVHERYIRPPLTYYE